MSYSLAVIMWPWQPQSTSSTHPHYPTSSLTYHHAPQHSLAAVPLPSQYTPTQQYMYPSGEFPFSSHLSPTPVDGWVEHRQSAVQSDSVSLPFPSPLPPRADIHITSPIPTLPPPPPRPQGHPSQQTTPTNVQQQPSHPPPAHTVTRSPFSVDFILREHAPPTPDGTEMTSSVTQYPQQPSGPTQGDPVATGYQSGMGDMLYPPPPLPPHPHTPSPQHIAQGFVEGGGVKQMTFDPGSHYGDKHVLPGFGGVAEGEGVGERVAVGQYPSTASPRTDSFHDNLQPFQLHSNYSPPPVSGAAGKMGLEGDGSEAPYSPPELIPEHQGDNQTDHSDPSSQVGERTNLTKDGYRDSSSAMKEGAPVVTQHIQSPSNAAKPTPTPAVTSPGEEGPPLIAAKTVPPAHLPIHHPVSPEDEEDDEYDMRPSAPKPLPLVRRSHNTSSDEEDDVFLPLHPPPTVTSSQEAPSSPPTQSSSSPPTYLPPTSPPPPPAHTSPPAQHSSCHGSETEEDETEKATTSSKSTPTNYSSLM